MLGGFAVLQDLFLIERGGGTPAVRR